MNDLSERVASAKEHAAPNWTPERERLVRARIDVKSSMRRKLRRSATVTLAFAALIAASLVLWRRTPVHAPQAAVHAAGATLLRLEDGSTAVATAPDARVEPVEIGATVASMRLLSGSARFSVTPNKNRTFVVLARDVTITVLGTVFSVNLEPGGVRVTVERGRVHVAWPAGERVLHLGEEAFIPDTPTSDERAGAAEAQPNGDRTPSDSERAQAASEAVPQEGEAAPADGERAQNDGERAHDAPPQGGTTEPTPGAALGPSPKKQPAQAPAAGRAASDGASWRTLAEDGDYSSAYKLMQSGGSGMVRDEPGDLLLAADVARLSGHPERAIGPLQRVVGKHAGDSRAPLAAFTLGRTLLDQLGRPREAATAFSTARRLEPRGAMAQDALAREVESWSRAGEASIARERAEAYVSLYPKGRRLGAVRRLGGLE